ncbi:putative heme peroxidase family protein [Diplodia seriata]|uniref:Putative heme peroxidase family protein n=1 Tax=Diplodia seriata TaxID=420778 RepID=A0A0G2GKR5_9PEZI|nr:putative heme peroxidase family protein [Diplodia seriata]
MFNFATIIIHDCFNTDHHGPEGTTKSSSYADLGPLYGHNKQQQDRVRLKKDGKLKNDTFAEWRLVSQPPGVCALMVAFNRFHNYVVEELARINEGGRFHHYRPDPTKSDAKQKEDEKKAEEKRDEDLFQTGRLITSGLYANIILGDYLRTILNLNDNKLKPGSDWTLDPRTYAPNVFDNTGTPRGVGNQVSAEFNFVYRWHATISDRDELWIDGLMKEVFHKEVHNNELPKNFYDHLEPGQFMQHVHEWQLKHVKEEKPEKWTFGHMERDHDGKFPDKKLVRLLTDATNTCAGDFGARNTPVALRVIEMLGIKQGRDWGLASLNEFRKFFGLKEFQSFEEINPDLDVSQALKALYSHPDNVELYPGLMSESTKEVQSPGAGLCPGFTISEAILADAVALVRGDRFYTIEYGPQGLTSFGFQELDSNKDVAGGGQMYKLLMRAFPGWYRSNSVYALYPFTTPQKTMNVFEERGTPNGIELSDKAPEHFPDPLPGAVHMPQQFNDPWDRLFVDLPPSNTGRHTRSSMPQPTDDQIRKFYESITRDLIRKKTLKLQEHKHQIDIVQDVGNIAHTVFAAKYFAIPIHDHPRDSKDSYTVENLHEELAHAFEYVFLDFDEAKSYQKRVRAYKGREEIREKMREVIRSWAQMIDYYLLPKNLKQWDKIAKQARSNEPRAFEELKRYFLEG